MKLDAQVDLLELKNYKAIDIDDTPIVALACGHFFTAQTLDGEFSSRLLDINTDSMGITGAIGLHQVYKVDAMTGEAVALEEIPLAMAPAIPKCPHCQIPIRQHVSPRYNRLINRAVIDQMTKRFIVTGQADLENLQQRLENVDRDLDRTRPTIIQTVS